MLDFKKFDALEQLNQSQQLTIDNTTYHWYSHRVNFTFMH